MSINEPNDRPFFRNGGCCGWMTLAAILAFAIAGGTAEAQLKVRINNAPGGPIPDDNLDGVVSRIALSDLGEISDVTVTLSINHSYVADIIASLSHVETGKAADLFNVIPVGSDLGAGAYRFNDAFAGDFAAAAASVGSMDIIPGGNYYPATVGGGESSLNGAFAGERTTGTWELKVVDQSAADVGTFNFWTLELTVPCGETVTGTLGADDARFDRIVSMAVDNLTCSAPSTLTGFMVRFDAIPIRSVTGGLFLAEILPGGTTVSDPAFTLYCDPFDPAQPDKNVVAFDNDGGGDNGMSAFTVNDGVFLQDNTRYWLVVSTFTNIDMVGDYELCLGPGVSRIKDSDGDGVLDDVDVCTGDDASGDGDGDGLCNNIDNCPGNANPGQEDADGNGIGDVCQDCCGGSIPVMTPLMLMGWKLRRGRNRRRRASRRS